MSLVYPASTQACAAIVVAFRALHVREELLRSLIAEWTQMGISEVFDIQFAYCHHHWLCTMFMRSVTA